MDSRRTAAHIFTSTLDTNHQLHAPADLFPLKEFLMDSVARLETAVRKKVCSPANRTHIGRVTAL
jgi:hypothetical protein